MISKNLFFIVVALVFLLVALSYAENTQAINAIEARELEQFKQLTPQNDENRTQIDTRDDNNNNNNETDQGDDVIVKGDDEDSTEDSSEDSSSSTDDDDIEPTENVDEPTTTDETEPTTTPTAETDGIDLPANEDGQPMKVLINQLIDDLNRRTKQGAGGDATLTPRTHKKRPWGGREHNRPRW